MGSPRYYFFYAVLVLTAGSAVLGAAGYGTYLWILTVTVPLCVLGIWDVLQTRHSILRNYPILAHLRFMFEEIRPELRQYFFESNLSGTPFSREQRSLVYGRAKDVEDRKPFGTELDVYAEGYRWVNHSIAPEPHDDAPLRIEIGGPDCGQPYSASLFNISAMSYGAISPNAIRAMNQGAKRGGFAHDTGEGGISRYHLEFGGDLIWEIGSGYFGCRNEDGSFNADMFAEQAAHDQVKMVEIKLSQGAKPGHGGVLPAAKITPEIAKTRRVPEGVDCVSPAAHSAFTTPMELMAFVAHLRDLSGGKPVGFKLCIGHRWEFMAICKAMLETGITPDFIVVDGSEGGTGAAPIEFSNRMGTPLRDGLQFVHNVLVGAGLRDRVKMGASGKLVSAFDIAAAMSLGADWCNSARGFMFAVGCIQSQSCHTNCCPVGVATQDEQRQRALVVPDKAERVYNFHRNTVRGLAEFVAASGLEQPYQLGPEYLYLRGGDGPVLPTSKAYRWLRPGELLHPGAAPDYAEYWAAAQSNTFTAVEQLAVPST